MSFATIALIKLSMMKNISIAMQNTVSTVFCKKQVNTTCIDICRSSSCCCDRSFGAGGCGVEVSSSCGDWHSAMLALASAVSDIASMMLWHPLARASSHRGVGGNVESSWLVDVT
jgi:hypothetical protein